MSLRLLVILFILMPFYCFSQHDAINESNTLVQSYTNENELQMNIDTSKRTEEFPTQIIRLNGKLDGQGLDCKQVNNHIEEILIKPFSSDQFILTAYIYCRYDPETFFATDFAVQSFFDPISDQAISYLKILFSEINGADLYGTTVHIESAKGLIVALTLATGMKKNPHHPPFIEYRKDRNNFYFSNNYEMRNQLIKDITLNFFSDDPNKILPFLDKWLFLNAGKIYKNVLRDSNYVELQPERIFLMKQGEKIFVSKAKNDYQHFCEGYQNHRCLRLD